MLFIRLTLACLLILTADVLAQTADSPDIDQLDSQCAVKSDSCLALAQYWLQADPLTGKNPDYEKARGYLEKACQQNNAAGCEILGENAHEGNGEKKDAAKAVRLYRQACELGLGHACYNLALCYEQGEGVEQDYREADRLYTRACNLKEPAGCMRF